FEDSPIIAHNAEFDRRFLNAELARLGLPVYGSERYTDTLAIARKRFPGASCSLDALARRFQLDRYGFDLAARKGPGGHGARVDAKFLPEVYLQPKGGREQSLDFAAPGASVAAAQKTEAAAPIAFAPRPPRPTALPPLISVAEAEAHAAFVEELGPNSFWRKAG